MRITSLVLPILCVAPTLAQDKHTLRLQFVPGQVVHMLQAQDMTMKMPNGEQKMSMYLWAEAKTADVKDGVATIEQTYRRMKAKADMGAKIDYDSDVEDSKPGMLAGASKLVGQTVTMKIDEGNNPKDFSVPEDVADGLERAGMNLKEGFELSFVSFPKDAIAIGDTWATTRTMSMGQMGTMNMKILNKLVELKDGVATIEQKLVMDQGASKLAAGTKVELTKGDGRAKVDLRNGSPVDMTLDMNLKINDTITMSTRMLAKQIEAPAPKAAPATTGGGK